MTPEEKYKEQRRKFIKQFKSDPNSGLSSISYEEIVSHLKRNFQNFKAIKRQNYVMYLCTVLLGLFKCCRVCKQDSQLQKFEKFMRKSQSLIDKELDFKKFITRQRVTTTAVLGLLSGR